MITQAIPPTHYVDVTNLPEEISAISPDVSSAIANDGRDDAAAIQAAIDWVTAQREAGSTDEAVVYIPEGVFDLAETLQVDVPGITFQGSGSGVTVVRNADSLRADFNQIPDSGVNIDSIDREAYLFDLDENANNVRFIGLTLTGPEIHGAILGVRADNLEISGAEFNNFGWSAIRLFALSGAEIHDSVFIDAGGEVDGTTGGSIYATYLSDAEIHNNEFSRSGDREGNVYGIKGRKFDNTRIHHNTIDVNFAIELPFENDSFVEIDYNLLDGVISIPKFGGGPVPENGFTFHIHHNYFKRSYSLEWTRSGAEVDHNVFVFDTERDNGNLISSFGDEPAPGPTKFHNNLVLNPGRGVFWSKGIYENFSFYNNEVIANETVTPRTEGLFGFNGETDFSTIEIRDNVIKVNGVSRPLVRNDASYDAIVENNTLSNISDASKLDNPDTGAPRGLLEPLSFRVGANEAFTVDGFDLRSAKVTSLGLNHSTGAVENNEDIGQVGWPQWLQPLLQWFQRWS
ncbi:MAG: right-handed parallel beta-helix repeat-containing protein [Elainellaceae cyanobacterium]